MRRKPKCGSHIGNFKSKFWHVTKINSGEHAYYEIGWGHQIPARERPGKRWERTPTFIVKETFPTFMILAFSRNSKNKVLSPDTTIRRPSRAQHHIWVSSRQCPQHTGPWSPLYRREKSLEVLPAPQSMRSLLSTAVTKWPATIFKFNPALVSGQGDIEDFWSNNSLHMWA